VFYCEAATQGQFDLTTKRQRKVNSI